MPGPEDDITRACRVRQLLEDVCETLVSALGDDSDIITSVSDLAVIESGQKDALDQGRSVMSNDGGLIPEGEVEVCIRTIGTFRGIAKESERLRASNAEMLSLTSRMITLATECPGILDDLSEEEFARVFEDLHEAREDCYQCFWERRVIAERVALMAQQAKSGCPLSIDGWDREEGSE